MKYNIGSQGQNLTLTSQTEGGLYDLFEKTFNIPSVIKSTKTIYLLENGKSSISLRFHEVGTINGLTATSLEDAFDKITAFIATLGGAGGSTVNTAFTQKVFATTMSVAHDTANPNFYIDVTGNLNLSITGTSNKDSGIINLNFTGTQVVTLTSGINKVITGAGVSIQVYFIHDESGLKWYRDETGNGGTVDTSNLAVQDGTVLYHILPRFTPTGTISTVGTNVTISSTQFSSNTVGNKLIINGESRIITAFTNNTTVIVASAFSVNYTNEPLANWNVYCRAVEIGSNGFISFLNNAGTIIARLDTGSSFSINGAISALNNNFFLGSSGLDLRSDHTLRHSSTTSQSGTKDIGLRRNAAGIYEVYDGVTNTGLEANRRDLLVRNLISKSNFYASDAAADADTALPSGAFYKITGSRVVNQKP